VDARPLVQTAEDFGFLGEDALTTLPGLSRRISEIDADSIAVGRGGRVAAVLLAAGGVVRVEANEPTIADDRRGLIDPAIDPDDGIWTVPESQPAALTVSNAESEPAPIANAWPGATEIAAMQVSRDGTRIAAIVTEGGRDWVSVAGVERNADGVPVALGTPERLLHPDGVGVDIAWLDDRTLGIIWEGTDGMIVTEQVVGGVSTSGDGPTGSAVSLAAGPTASSARLLTAEGALYVRRGTTWQRAAEDVLVLASQLGAN
jgi:hypothetical protein